MSGMEMPQITIFPSSAKSELPSFDPDSLTVLVSNLTKCYQTFLKFQNLNIRTQLFTLW